MCRCGQESERVAGCCASEDVTERMGGADVDAAHLVCSGEEGAPAARRLVARQVELLVT